MEVELLNIETVKGMTIEDLKLYEDKLFYYRRDVLTILNYKRLKNG